MHGQDVLHDPVIHGHVLRIHVPQGSPAAATTRLLNLLLQLSHPYLGPVLVLLVPLLLLQLTGHTWALVTWLIALVDTGMTTASLPGTGPELAVHLTDRHVTLTGQIMATCSLVVHNCVAYDIRELGMARLGGTMSTGGKNTHDHHFAALGIHAAVMVPLLIAMDLHFMVTGRKL